MADSRMIRIGFLDSDRVAALSWRAECFYHRLLLVADDHGLFDARLSVLRTRLFPLCLDKVREADLQRTLAECEGAGLVRLYEVQGKPYLEILNYGQRCQSKPKYPLPSTVSRGDSPCGTVTHGEPPGFTAKTESESETQSNTETESVSPYPVSTEELQDYAATIDISVRPRTAFAFERSVLAFWDWIADPLNRRKVTDWRSRLRSWLKQDALREAEKEAGRRQAGNDANQGRRYK